MESTTVLCYVKDYRTKYFYTVEYLEWMFANRGDATAVSGDPCKWQGVSNG